MIPLLPDFRSKSYYPAFSLNSMDSTTPVRGMDFYPGQNGEFYTAIDDKAPHPSSP
jgi:hypothetical protein